MNEFKLIIICGARRSGTTLLNAILCSDERANLLGQEAQILTRLVEAYRWGKENFSQFGSSFFNDKSGLQSIFQKMLRQYAEDVAARIAPAGVLILKNPEFSPVLDDLSSLLPYAAIVATIRDPRDQVASELEVAKRRLTDAGEDASTLHRNVAALARRNANFNHQIIRTKNEHPDRILTVRYEDLIKDPRSIIDRLSEWTGLNLSFDPHTNWEKVSPLAALDQTPSRSVNYGKPISSISVGRYRDDLNADEILEIEQVCGELMAVFGYGKLEGLHAVP